MIQVHLHVLVIFQMGVFMKKMFLVALFALFFSMVGCVSAPHRSENSLMKTENGNTHVKIELHDNDPREIGSQINAFDKQCKRGNPRLGSEETCSYLTKGIGRIVSLEDKMAIVEFPASTVISSNTLFESVSK